MSGASKGFTAVSAGCCGGGVGARDRGGKTNSNSSTDSNANGRTAFSESGGCCGGSSADGNDINGGHESHSTSWFSSLRDAFSPIWLKWREILLASMLPCGKVS